MRKILNAVMIMSVVLVLNGCDSWDDFVDSISGSGDDKKTTSSVTTTGTPATVTKTSSTPAPPTVTKTSNRFDHYNPQAWDGNGVAVVMCGNDARMESCSLDGKAMSLHGSQDKGRDAWTIRGRSGYGGTITCKRGSNAYSFRVGSRGITWGGCR
jgi:hypothetical protein